MADDYIYKLNPGQGWMFKGGPRSSPVAPFTGAYKGGTSLNMGWKIHFDLKSTLSLQDSLKEAGMDASQNIIDSSKFKSVAQRYLSYSGGSLSDKEVAQGIYNTINFGRRQLPGGVEYEQLFPRITDIFDTADVLKSQGMDFKFGANTYGNWTAYPSSLERRDKLIASLESSIGSRLEEAKNIESSGSDLLSRYTKGRFTSQYMKQIPEFMKHSWSEVLPDEEFQKLPPLQRIQERVFSSAKNFPDTLKKFLASEPILEELMFGPKGYVSPYEDMPSLLKSRGISIDIPGRTAITPITPHATTVTPSNIPNTPQLKQSPEPIIKITPHAKPVMNIPGHGQVIDPIEIATRRAQRQKDLNVAFNQMQMREVNAERKAALPGKKLNKAQRRAAKNARALDVQRVKEQGALLAREEAEKLKAQQAAQQVVQSRSISGTKKGRNSRIKTKHPGGFNPKKGIFTVTTNFDEYLTIPDPATMKPGSLESYARNKVLRPRFEEQGRVHGTTLFEEIQRIGGYEGVGESELERVLKTTIGQTQDDLLREHLKGLKKQYGPAYRAHLRDIATQSIQNDREYFYWNKGLQIDTNTPRPILPINMSEDDALSHISRRVQLDGGTVSTNKNLPGFGQGVKDMVDQSIVSRGQVVDILKGKDKGAIGLGNVVDLPKNAQQVVLNLDLEDDMRLSYGEALLQSSRMEQQGGNLSTGKQKQLGARANLADKQAMMVDDEKIQRGVQERVSLLEKDKRRAAVQAEKIQAVLSQGSSEVGETIIPPRLAPAAEQAEEVVRKAPISKRTMEKMMSSNMLAAGVAAGGLGLIYASNRMKGEREVGR